MSSYPQHMKEYKIKKKREYGKKIRHALSRENIHTNIKLNITERERGKKIVKRKVEIHTSTCSIIHQIRPRTTSKFNKKINKY